MSLFIKGFINLASLAVIAAITTTSFAGSLKKNGGMKIETNTGTMIIEFYPEVAPLTVKQISTLVKEGFYDGVSFHRVLPNFMVQGGDPTGTGSGGSELPNIPAEFSKTAHHKKGTLAMARTGDPNSANSQFYICHTDTSCKHLDGQYTVFGQVVEGLDVIGKIKQGDKMAKVTLIEAE